MLTPFRGVIAMSDSHCDMEEMQSASSHDEMAGTHDMSMMASTVSMHQHNPPQYDQVAVEQAVKKHQCCCCDNDGSSCVGNCDMGITVSLLMQATFYAPVFIDVTEPAIFSPELVLRELTPPSRPPAILS